MIRLAATMAALIAGHTALETARDARFLQELPPSRLAIAYGVMALLTILTAPLAARLVAALGRRRALTVTLAATATVTAGFAIAPGGPAAAMALHLWTGASATVLTVQFWLLATEVVGDRAGRLLPPIAAAGTVGALAGAAAATVVAPAGVAAVLAIAAFAYGLAAAAVRVPPRSAAAIDPAGSARWSPPRRAHVRRLAAVVALSTSALLVADYLFKLTVAGSVPPDELPAFFARYHAVVSALALIVQVGGLGWVTAGRRRLVVAMTALPLLVLVGAVAAFALPLAIVGVVVAKGADGVLRHSLHRVSLELLWTPLPARLRARAKPSIDGVLVRATQALTAGGLLIAGASPTALAAAIAAISALWLAAATRLRRAI